MSSGQAPPWLQEQLAKMQQSQQNLQSIMTQKHHLEAEKLDTTKALEELNNAAEDDTVYKQVGMVLLKSTRAKLISDLEEAQEMMKTRTIVLDKQETRLKEQLKEQEINITNMMKGSVPGASPEGANPRK